MGKLGPYCMHLKGRGGIKGSVRLLHRKLIEFPFAARFDVKSFYGSINHKILLRLINNLDIKPTGGTPVVHQKPKISEIMSQFQILKMQERELSQAEPYQLCSATSTSLPLTLP